jgi:hypothetical protein
MLSAMAKYVINRLIHGLFHIALVISPRLISSLGLKPPRPISRSRADNKALVRCYCSGGKYHAAKYAFITHANSTLLQYVITHHTYHFFIFCHLFIIMPIYLLHFGLKPPRPISRSRADNKGNMKKAMY